MLRCQCGVVTYAIDREHQQVCLTGQACQQVEVVLDAAVVVQESHPGMFRYSAEMRHLMWPPADIEQRDAG